MLPRQALGIVETRGLLALVEATDAALKAAQVDLLSWQLVGGGLVTSFLTGDVGAVNAAMMSAKGAIERLGQTGTVHVIARPHPEVWPILPGPDKQTSSPKASNPVAIRPETTPTVKPESSSPALRPKAAAAPMVQDKKIAVAGVEPKAEQQTTKATPAPKKSRNKAPKAKK